MCATVAIVGLVIGHGTASGPRQATFRSSVDLVRLDVIVTKAGRPVPDLGPTDFEIIDNGVPQRASLVARTSGASVLLALDASDSVAGNRVRELASAARGVVERLSPADRAGLIVFSDRPVLRVPVGAGEVTRRAITTILDGLSGGGRTALNDTVVAGTKELSSPGQGGAMLLVFTDGEDSASTSSATAALDAVRHSEATVGIVATGLATGVREGPVSAVIASRAKFLRSLADASGGPFLEVEFGRTRLAGAFAQVLDEFKARYIFTFRPECVGLNDGWHTLKVKVAPGLGQARTRAGYVAAASGPAVAPCGSTVAALDAVESNDRADDRADYATVVKEYRSGHTGAATRSLATWDRARLRKDAGPPSVPAPDPATLAAMALLHTETGTLVRTMELRRAHLELAERLVDRLRKAHQEPAFRKTWYLLADSLARVNGDETQAARLRGYLASEWSNDADVQLARGSDDEMQEEILGGGTPDRMGSTRVRASRTRGLAAAEQAYTAALSRDPELVEAHLRLGRVLYLTNRHDRAVSEFEYVRTHASQPFLAYLANLFLGQVHEKRGQREPAERCYRVALASVPDAQTAMHALDRLRAANNREEPDWALTTFMRPERMESILPTDDPWLIYGVGQFWRATERLSSLKRSWLGR